MWIPKTADRHRLMPIVYKYTDSYPSLRYPLVHLHDQKT